MLSKIPVPIDIYNLQFYVKCVIIVVMKSFGSVSSVVNKPQRTRYYARRKNYGKIRRRRLLSVSVA